MQDNGIAKNFSPPSQTTNKQMKKKDLFFAFGMMKGLNGNHELLISKLFARMTTHVKGGN
jgi:hypothetical protein